MDTCSNMHSRNALLLSTMDRNLGSVLSQPAMFLSINDARVVLVQALEEIAQLLYLEGGQRPSQVGDIQTRVNEGLLLGKKVRARPAPDESSTHLSCRSESSNI